MILGANGKEVAQARCIAWSDRSSLTGAPICGEVIPQGHLFCAKDWKLVSHGVRQALIQEQARLRAIRSKMASYELQQLVQVAVKQNLDARCAADPAFAKSVIDFAEQTKAAQRAASAGLEIPNGERFGIPTPPKEK